MSKYTQERIEDEIVHAAKQREGKASVEGVPQQRPDRPAPLHRMQVPAGAVGDLLAVWDFLKVRVRFLIYRPS